MIKVRSSIPRELIRAIEGKPSSLFFTTHKCASTFVSRYLSEINRIGQLECIDYAGLSWGKGLDLGGASGDKYDFFEEHGRTLFAPKGCIYGPLRKPIDFDGDDLFRKVVFLRNPIDILISQYYSFGYTHPIPPVKERKEVFLRRRSRIQKLSLEEYVLSDDREEIKRIYNDYFSLKEHQLLTYEFFRSSRYSFCQALNEFLGVTVSAQELLKVLRNVDIRTKLFLKKTHLRSGDNDQAKSKLSPVVEGELREYFKSELSVIKSRTEYLIENWSAR